MMEEGLAAQLAEFKANFSDRDLKTIARSGRLVAYSGLVEQAVGSCLIVSFLQYFVYNAPIFGGLGIQVV